MSDVTFELLEGGSGYAAGGVDGKAIVAGVCSLGQIGKGYLIGQYTDVETLLGVGPLVDRVRDIIATAGAKLQLVAVPVRGQPGSYVSQPMTTNSRVPAKTVGVAQKNADILVKVTSPGAIGIAALSVSLDNGKTWESKPSAENVTLGDTGAILIFPENALLEEDAEFRIIVRTAIGPLKRIGDESGPMLEITGLESGVLASAELVVQIEEGGGRNEGTYRLSIDGGDNFGKLRTIPVDGVAEVVDYGVKLHFPEGEYIGGTNYTCNLLAPAPTIVDIMSALESPLELYDIEFVHIAGPSDSVAWAAMAVKADELFSKQRPTYFRAEPRLPYDGEDLNDYTAYLLKERENIAARFVIVCAQYGEITDASGERRLRNWGGLLSGRVMRNPVQRASGRVKDGPIVQGSLPAGWEAVQKTLQDAGYVTAKKRPSLGVYWSAAPTMCAASSKYRREEILRVVFKGIRKVRIAAELSMYDEAGDPLFPEEGGIAFVKAEVENALATMTTANPKELAGFVVDIPLGQDIANNGLNILPTLIGIPIIEKMHIPMNYVVAGGRFDPRIIEQAGA